MPAMSHGWRALIGGIREEDDRGGTIISRKETVMVPLSEVRGGVGGRVSGRTL